MVGEGCGVNKGRGIASFICHEKKIDKGCSSPKCSFDAITRMAEWMATLV